ncbi:MAG: phosphate ABC transporter substrate-binding protein PstS [Rhodoplanes sp.]|uniref:phosphate ABC transporter substrate-binding protein PstS n=1 Tax=Rhodoplanes sp. TaxID=1968906 RepID=UPI00185859EC|nr:phosphate ABC transporter substrate-binding protein PstS [Rhodoplanes sp.]NVO17209.1 phosphate ABC transporter substrate-binding protein PstS [Rhodoplanes sp.]
MTRIFRAPLVAAVVSMLALVASTGQDAAMAQDRLIGSGASFPFPIYSAWFKQFSKETPGVIVDYQAKGSGAGIQDFINRTVDFAASDAAMTDAELAKVDGGAVLIPITAGEIVIAYNLPGNPTGLKLPRDVYPDIFLGKVTRWNDPRIAAANPDLKLPDLPITVVRRSDSSGTTFVFTKHLSAISPEFAKQVGSGTTVEWPKSDKIVGAPKNDGVTATVKQTPGAIGYIEYGYAKLTKTTTAALQNKSGQYVEPSAKSGAATLAAATLGPDLRGWIEDPEGAEAYPIATFTWLLFYKKQDAKKAAVLRQLVDYSVTKGQAIADSMGYIPLPPPVIDRIKAAAAEIK